MRVLGLQTLKPYTNFLPVENPAKAFSRSAPGFGQETSSCPARAINPSYKASMSPNPR